MKSPPVVAKLSAKSLERIYSVLERCHKDHLKARGVQLPRLRNADGSYVQKALALCYLARDWPRPLPVSKTELTKFVRLYHPDVNDVQSGRHLAAQNGWWIVSGTRENIVRNPGAGFYQLHSLERPYPKFKKARRSASAGFDQIKAEYQHRCATCGSVEGMPHLRWPAAKTKLQRAHMDPAKPLSAQNTIPQCLQCNRADKDKWVYDRKGRVVAAASPLAVARSSRKVKREIYERLRGEFAK